MTLLLCVLQRHFVFPVLREVLLPANVLARLLFSPLSVVLFLSLFLYLSLCRPDPLSKNKSIKQFFCTRCL